MLLKDKFAIVTGASTGIGRAIALEFVKEGAFLFLVSRSKVGLEGTLQLIKNLSGKAEISQADLSDIKSINGLIEKIKQRTNHVDIIVNAAAIWHSDKEVYAGIDFDKFKQKVILDTYTVGFTAPTILAHSLIPFMPKKGKILNISGTFESGAKGWLPYYASKRALEDFTTGLASELKERDIQINCISPSDTATEAFSKYFPQYLKDAISPEEIAHKAVELCSTKSDHTSGSIIVMKKDEKPYEKFHA